MTLQTSNTGSRRNEHASQDDQRRDGLRGRPPQLAPLSRRGRLIALALATLAATVSVGSQLGLVALYSGEAAVALAKLKPSGAASQTVASALPIARRSQSTATKFDPAQGARWPWSHPYAGKEESP